jgi:hypothetical protein
MLPLISGEFGVFGAPNLLNSDPVTTLIMEVSQAAPAIFSVVHILRI